LRQTPATLASSVANVSTAATKIADATTKLDGIIGKSEALIGAVNPDDLKTAIANIRTVSDSFAAQSSRLGKLVDRADAIAANAQAFSQHLRHSATRPIDARQRRPGEGQAHARQYRSLHHRARREQHTTSTRSSRTLRMSPHGSRN